MAQETVYIKPSSRCTVYQPNITIGDVMKVECPNVGIVRQVKQMDLYRFNHEHAAVLSVMVVIERIHRDYPNVEIENCGESDFIIEYVKEVQKSALWECIKLVLVGVFVFFGSAFTIMAFHNDIDIQGVFDRFYLQLMGTSKPMVTELEISYSVGIAVGIVVFYNHVSKKRLTKDPTPVEVELKKYNKDLISAEISMADQKGHKIDVS